MAAKYRFNNQESLQKDDNVAHVLDFGLQMEDMLDIYILYIRSILESSAVVWHSSIPQAEITAIERVQKVALRIILDDEYESYDHALRVTGLPTLKERRTNLCK